MFYPYCVSPQYRIMRFSEKSAQSKMEDGDPSVRPPCKSVPQSMVDNVMAVCPDVDPKDVAKDLVITGSTTRTINRILDGQVSKTFIPATRFSRCNQDPRELQKSSIAFHWTSRLKIYWSWDQSHWSFYLIFSMSLCMIVHREIK